MKKLILVLVVFLNFSCSSKKTQDLNSIIISQKSSNQKGVYLKLKNISNDSRCPQGVDCVWAGEVTAEIEVYENKVLKEEKTVVFNSKNREENNKWFSKYFTDKEIKTSYILPQKENDKVINMKDYYIKIHF